MGDWLTWGWHLIVGEVASNGDVVDGREVERHVLLHHLVR